MRRMRQKYGLRCLSCSIGLRSLGKDHGADTFDGFAGGVVGLAVLAGGGFERQVVDGDVDEEVPTGLADFSPHGIEAAEHGVGLAVAGAVAVVAAIVRIGGIGCNVRRGRDFGECVTVDEGQSRPIAARVEVSFDFASDEIAKPVFEGDQAGGRAVDEGRHELEEDLRAKVVGVVGRKAAQQSHVSKQFFEVVDQTGPGIAIGVAGSGGPVTGHVGEGPDGKYELCGQGRGVDFHTIRSGELRQSAQAWRLKDAIDRTPE